jgi:sigma-E factor negative regulatory protein RseB
MLPWSDMKRGPELLASLAFGAALVGATGAAAGDFGVGEGFSVSVSPEVLLTRMTESSARIEYEGTLVYLHDHQLATLRIAHRIHDGVSRESLLALSGPIRAIARNDRGVTCVLPDSHPISMPRADGGSSMLRSGPFDFERIRRHYLLHMLGQSRVAGRDTDVVGIVPRDNFRYGYRYFIDRDTGLALKIDLMDNASEPIEQVMFTSVAIHSGPDGELRAVPPAIAELPRSSEGSVPAREGWRVARLPPGFEVVKQDAQPNGPAAAMEHIVVSDGLASLSIYIESAGDEEGLQGATRMGAVNAAGKRLGNRHVTVVGEVPKQTALMVLEGVEPVGR